MNIIQRSAYRLLKQGVFAGGFYINTHQQCCAIGVLLDDPKEAGNGMCWPPAPDGYVHRAAEALMLSQPDLTMDSPEWPQLQALQRAHDSFAEGHLFTVAALAQASLRLADSTNYGQTALVEVSELLRAMECPFCYEVDGKEHQFTAEQDAVFGNWQIHTYRTMKGSASRAVDFMRQYHSVELKEIEA